MHELFLKIKSELRNSWRFRWHGFAAVWFVAIVGWAYTFMAPNQYQSWARVHVDTAYILRPLLRGMVVEPDLNEEVHLLTRTLLGRQNLEQIANNANLNLGGLTATQKDQLFDELRDQIHITGLGNDLYDIRYSNHDPAKAKKVVQQVLSILMSDALGSTQQDSESAQKFLKEQLASYGKQLNQAEQALAKFKRANLGYMPTNGGDYTSQLQDEEQNRDNLRNELDVAESEMRTLKKQVGGTSVQPAQDPEVMAMNSEIQKDQQTLYKLLTQYTSAYPEVISLKARIVLEKKQRDVLIDKLKSSKTDTFDTNSQIYQKMSLRANKVSVKIQGLKTQLKQVNNLIVNQRKKADRIAEVQANLDALTRNYQITKKQYNLLLQRLYSAKLSQSAQSSGNPLKFQVIDPPRLPRIPVSPKRELMALVALLFAIGVGVALTYILSQIKPVFQSRIELSEMFSLPVYGAIPMVDTSKSLSNMSKYRLKQTLFPLCCVLFLIIGVFAVVFSNEGAELVRIHFLGSSL